MDNRKANYFKETGANRGACKRGGRWVYIPNTERWLAADKPAKLERWQGPPSAAILKVMNGY